MKPLLLKLQGFKGIRSGSGQEEIEIDLTAHEGLTAITGPNGSGKTTVLDNLHPYRIMPSRAGGYSPRSFSFYNECYGSDAMKELHFDLDDCKFKSVVLIDAERKKQEAYLYEWVKGQWEPLCDGKVDNYDRAVTDLLGSSQLFFTSVFRCQDAPRLSNYTKGEIKDIFIELLSIETLRKTGARARERKSTFLKEVEWLKRERERLSNVIDNSEKAKEEFIPLQREVKTSEEETSDLAEKIVKKQEELRALEGRNAIFKKSIEESGQVKDKISKLSQQLKAAEEVLSKADLVKDASTNEQRHLCKLELLKKELPRLEEEITKLQSEERKYREADKECMAASNTISDLRLSLRHRQSSLNNDLMRAKESTRLLGEVPCGSEYHGRCKFLQNAVKEREKVPVLMTELRSYEKNSGEETALATKIKRLENSLIPFKKILEVLDEAVKEKESVLKDIRSSESEIEKTRELSKLMAEITFNEKVYPGLKEELKRYKQSLKDLEQEDSPAGSLKVVEDALRELAIRRDRVSEEQRVRLQRLAVLESVISNGEAAGKELKSLHESIECMNGDISEWSILEQAFGNDGIVALEIDDAGPVISSVANDLLLSCFGPRFTVRIDTQAARSSGKGLKETFDIIVFDSERNESKSLKSMSGGEKVWVEEAITRSISLYNARKSDRKFHALFTDEKDGALDFQRKKEYLAMKKKVMEVGGYDIEYFISHSPEIQEAADSTIVVKAA